MTKNYPYLSSFLTLSMKKYQSCVLVFDSYAYQNKTRTLISRSQERTFTGLAAMEGKSLKRKLNLL